MFLSNLSRITIQDLAAISSSLHSQVTRSEMEVYARQTPSPTGELTSGLRRKRSTSLARKRSSRARLAAVNTALFSRLGEETVRCPESVNTLSGRLCFLTGSLTFFIAECVRTHGYKYSASRLRSPMRTALCASLMLCSACSATFLH